MQEQSDFSSFYGGSNCYTWKKCFVWLEKGYCVWFVCFHADLNWGYFRCQSIHSFGIVAPSCDSHLTYKTKKFTQAFTSPARTTAPCTVCPAKSFLLPKPVLSYFHCLPMTPESTFIIFTISSDSSPIPLTTLLAHFSKPCTPFQTKDIFLTH